MHPEMEMWRCAIMRCGTSKGVYIMMNQYPKDPARRDAVVLAIYGQPSRVKIKRLGVFRTARRIMEGYIYVRKSVFK